MLRIALSVVVAFCISTSLLAQQMVAVTGIVKDASGTAVPGAVVQLSVADSVIATATTDRDGRYELLVAAGVPFTLIARLRGFGDEVVRVAGVEHDTTRDLRLQVGRLADTVVVTATRSAESLSRVTQSVTVATAQDIDALGATSLADVMRFVPGVAVESSGREGAVTRLFSRGGESDYNLVLVDGVRVNMDGGTFDFSRIAAGEIDRIEVVRGAQSALYGSDAMGAVVQVFTRRAAATDAPRLSGSFEGGSFKTARTDVWLTGGDSDRFDYALGLAARRTDGAFSSRLPEDDHFDQTAIDVSVGNAMGPRASFRTGLRYSDADGRLVGQIGYGILNTGGTARTKDFNWYLNLNHTTGTRYAGTATVNYYRANDLSADTGTDATANVYALLSGTPGALFPDGPRLVRLLTASEFNSLAATTLPAGQFVASTPFGFGDFPFSSRTQFRRPAFRYAGDLLWGAGQRVTVGYEWERETNALISSQRLTNNAVFVQQQFSLGDRWFAMVGARIDDKSTYDAFVSPRLSAGGYVLPAGAGAVSSVKVFGNIGKGIKSPNFFERFGGSFADPSPDLKVERARSMDAGVEITLAAQRIRTSATVFRSHFRDQIEFRSTSPFFAPDGQPDYLNIAGSNSHGLELEGALQRPYAGVTVAATYAYVPTEVIETTDLDAQFRPGQPLLRRPAHSGTFRIDYRRAQVGLHWDTRIVGQRHDSSFIGLLTPTFTPAEISVNPGYTVSGLGVEFRAQPAATLYFRADNIFDKEYEGALGYPGMPRSAVVGVRVDLAAKK